MARKSAVFDKRPKGLAKVSASNLAMLASLILSIIAYVVGIRPLLPIYYQGVLDLLLCILLLMIGLRAGYALVKE